MTSPHRILVTGSRDWSDWQAVHDALDEAYLTVPRGPVIVVHGACRTGTDAHAQAWVTAAAVTCPVTAEPHPSAWDVHGRAAGPRRNADMVNHGADLCLAFIKNGSRGATGCANLAEAAGIPTRRWTT